MGEHEVVEARPLDVDPLQNFTDLEHRRGEDLEDLPRSLDVSRSFRLMDGHDLTVAGYTVCRTPDCGALVLDEVAYKTRGHCAPCFRANANIILDAAITVVAGREKLVLKTRQGNKTDGERAQRKRAKKRAKATAAERAKRKKVAMARIAADRRLRRLFPELWEILLADERAKLGLNAWTIDRTLTPGEATSSLEFLAKYRRL